MPRRASCPRASAAHLRPAEGRVERARARDAAARAQRDSGCRRGRTRRRSRGRVHEAALAGVSSARDRHRLAGLTGCSRRGRGGGAGTCPRRRCVCAWHRHRGELRLHRGELLRLLRRLRRRGPRAAAARDVGRQRGAEEEGGCVGGRRTRSAALVRSINLGARLAGEGGCERRQRATLRHADHDRARWVLRARGKEVRCGATRMGFESTFCRMRKRTRTRTHLLVDAHLPVVHARREADGAEHHAALAAAR